MRILSAPFVSRWRGRIINIHPSLLPSFPGLDTHRRALQAGVKIHGCTVHFVESELDAGPIIAQSEIAVLDDDTPESLAARVLEKEHELYARALSLVASGKATIANGRTQIATA
jgi:formyltetrahydrofolate-dependent phosphoribosylglycinamide formyltransferase